MYLPKFKEKTVQRIMEGAVVAQLTKGTGVASTTLLQWRRDSLMGRMAMGEDQSTEVKNRRVLTPIDKARLLAEADLVEAHEFGARLRARGLHEAFTGMGRDVRPKLSDAVAVVNRIAGEPEVLVHDFSTKGDAVDRCMTDEGLVQTPR